MNKVSTIVLWVLGVLILGGIVYAVAKNNNSSVTATTTPTTQNTNTNPPVTQNQSGLPVVVTSTTVVPSDTTAVVTGNINPMGAFTTYWYEYGTTASLGNKTVTQSLGSGFTAIQAPHFITNLAKDTTYFFKLVAENQYGRVSGNQYSFKTTTGTPAPLGNAPTTKTLAATGISRTTANINGEVTPNQNPTQYWFEYGKTTQLGSISVFSGAGDGTTKTTVSISLSDLEPATTYYFRLNAQNRLGTVNGSILNFKTAGPAAATAPKVVSQNATAINDSNATLHGTVSPNGAETTYWFEYSTDSLLGSVLLTTTPEVTLDSNTATTAVKADVTGLDSQTTYYSRLVARNSQGTVRGDKITFKTK
jgi:hypothetical protein